MYDKFHRSIQFPVIEPSVADVFITSELEKRAPKKTDYLQEKQALHELARIMADFPKAVLPRFVDLAMAIALTKRKAPLRSVFHSMDRWCCAAQIH